MMGVMLRLTIGLVLLGFGGLLTDSVREIRAWWINQSGTRAYKAGQFRDALQAFERATELMPQSPTLQFNRGTALFALKKIPEARRFWQSAARSFDQRNGAQRAAAHYNIGNTYFAEKNWREAAEAYKRALKLTPSDQDAKYNLELVLRQQKQQPQTRQQTRPPLPPPPPIERESQQKRLRRLLISPWHGDKDW
ncbi:MAG: tetratricopeptide repeat protein [Armatimonadetes bacterium]|nr:tetratricopeptide repeat protein [Armatimonadota bacterium]MDW8121350.1 tetratricopeptide repeat protein [Armatimonadota bacterium]